mgnify:CR=1 FL=1
MVKMTPAAKASPEEAAVWTILFSRILECRKRRRIAIDATAAGIEAEPLGRTIASRMIFELNQGDFAIPLDELRKAHEGFFPALMGADAALA